MAWTLTDPLSSVTVGVTPVSGAITISHDRETGVLWPLRGSAPFVQNGPQRVASINTPPLLFTSKATWEEFINLVSLGRRLVLADDMGGSWPVRIDGKVDTEIADTADRASKPRYLVKVKLVGVA